MFCYKRGIWICLCLWSFMIFAAVDPFQGNQIKKIKLLMTKKYQYLGYIKGPQLYRGFVRVSGGEVQGLNLGRNRGFGEVILINKQQICILKQKQHWCLDKSAQAKLWHLGGV